MYAFDYRRPATLNEADLALKAAPGAKLLAGGQTLIPTMKQRLAQPAMIIDLSAIPDLKAISRKGDDIHIGAMVTHAEVAASQRIGSCHSGARSTCQPYRRSTRQTPRHHRWLDRKQRSGCRLPGRSTGAWRDDAHIEAQNWRLKISSRAFSRPRSTRTKFSPRFRSP